MYPNQIQPKSIEIQPFVVSTAAYAPFSQWSWMAKKPKQFLKGPGGKADFGLKWLVLAHLRAMWSNALQKEFWTLFGFIDTA